MSYDLVELIGERDFKDTTLQVGLQCAPLLAGIKAANLFTISKDKVEEIEDVLKGTVLSYVLLYEGRERVVYLIYDEEKLQAFLSSCQIEPTLMDFGYPSGELKDILPIFIKRYETYMNERKRFPHELGLLLEYPLADVLGFIKYKGKNFLHSGYWKVYEKREEKIRLFQRFEEVQCEITRFLMQGSEISEIIAFYGALDQNLLKESTKVQVA